MIKKIKSRPHHLKIPHIILDNLSRVRKPSCFVLAAQNNYQQRHFLIFIRPKIFYTCQTASSGGGDSGLYTKISLIQQYVRIVPLELQITIYVSPVIIRA